MKIIEYTCNAALFPNSNDILCCNQITIDECIELPDYKPNIQTIVDVKATPEIDSYKFIDTPIGKKIFIKGHLDQQVLYMVDSLCQSVHGFLSVSPFCTFMQLPHCYAGEYNKLEAYQPKILVEYMESVQLSCRSIRKSIMLFTWYPKGIIALPKRIHPYVCIAKPQYNSALLRTGRKQDKDCL